MVCCFCRHYKENVRIMKESCNIGEMLACPACPKVCMFKVCIAIQEIVINLG